MLTEQRKLFVDEYLKRRCKDQRGAAIAAGYSPKSAAQQACDILKLPEVQDYLKEQKDKIISEIQQEFVFAASDAVKVMYNIMKDPVAENRDKINAAKDFLDRAGFKAPDKVERITEVKNNLFEAIKDSAKEAGDCITIDLAKSN